MYSPFDIFIDLQNYQSNYTLDETNSEVQSVIAKSFDSFLNNNGTVLEPIYWYPSWNDLYA
jgi:hypothetical protein